MKTRLPCSLAESIFTRRVYDLGKSQKHEGPRLNEVYLFMYLNKFILYLFIQN